MLVRASFIFGSELVAVYKAYIRTGLILGGPSGITDYTSLVEYNKLEEYQLGKVRRKKPIGVERLFNGTNVSSWRWRQRPGIVIVRTDQTGGAWRENRTQLNAPSLGPGPSAQSLPTKYWSNRLLKAIRDTDLNLAQAFAERAQVEHMFVDYGKRVLKAYSAARRGRPNEVLNALLGTQANKAVIRDYKKVVSDSTKVASDTWLAWQYGIRPLISDLKGAVSEYYKVRAASPVIRAFHLKASNDERMGGFQSGPATDADHPAYVYQTQYTQTGRISCYAEFQDSAQSWDQSAQRLGLTDPALLAWELIPYSFVIDWFVNVGDFLQASGTFIGLKRVGIHLVTTNHRVDIASKGTGQAFGEYVLKMRTFTTSLPSAQLSIKAHPLSLSHVTSALALIRQVRF